MLHASVLRYDAAMSAAKPKRRFWQFHLSTAVVMTIAAGFLLYGTLQPSIYKFHGKDIVTYGWPISYFYDDSSGWCVEALIIDVLACIIVLPLAAYMLEWLLRRREARKT